MKRTPVEILKEALELPPDERSALATSFIDSLDQDVNEGAKAAWELEIARRLQEIDSGQVKLVRWADASRRLGGGHGPRRG